jgi:hypothetical protein
MNETCLIQEKKINLKFVYKARVGNGPLQFDSTEAGIICSFFLITLLALLIFLYLMNTGTLGMIGLKTL